MIQFQIEKLSEVTSTNSLLLERAKQGAAEGLVVVTDYQTSGRGKPGREWTSPKGRNLLFSVLLRPPITSAQAPLLTQIACRAVAKVLKEKYDIESAFKRPNDVMVESKKICGTLVEAIASPKKLEAAVIGIGLNVNATTQELPEEGVSMKTVTGKIYPREEILGYILEELGVKLEEFYRTRTMTTL